jgi:hypothetical protein
MNQMANSLVMLDFAPLAEPILNGTAATLIQDYRDNGGWQNGQTKSVFFKKAEMENFMKMMGDLKAEGVNIYFARYPDDGSLNPKDHAEYSKRETVVFVLTDSNGNDLFDPETKPTVLPALSMAFDHGELNP